MKKMYPLTLANGKGCGPCTESFIVQNHKALHTPIYSYRNHGSPAVIVTLAACWKGSKLEYSRKPKMDLEHSVTLQVYLTVTPLLLSPRLLEADPEGTRLFGKPTPSLSDVVALGCPGNT